MAGKPDWLADATIGVVTALPVEFAAAWQVLGCTAEVPAGGRMYRAGLLPRKDAARAHTVVVCCLNDMGNVSAAAGTMVLLGDCRNLEAVVMCGIAGGIPSPRKPDDDIHLGDIVVPSRQGVVQYDHESVKEHEVEIRARMHIPSRILLAASRQLAAGDKVGQRPWDDHIAQALADMERNQKGSAGDWSRPGPKDDVLQEFSEARKGDHVKRALASALRSIGVSSGLPRYGPIPRASDCEGPLGRPRVFHGVLASASKLQRNMRTRDFLKTRFGAIAIDMESAGVAEAAFERDVDFFAVRSASDYCNESKNVKWHQYCALAAAAYTKALLEVTQLPRLSTPSVGPTTVSTEMQSAQNIGRDLARAVDRGVEDQARATLEEIGRCLDTWEFRSAFSLADNQDTWIEQHLAKLPRKLVQELYTILVRVEIVRANQNRQPGQPVDTTRAEYYLAKAKNVGNG